MVGGKSRGTLDFVVEREHRRFACFSQHVLCKDNSSLLDHGQLRHHPRAGLDQQYHRDRIAAHIEVIDFLLDAIVKNLEVRLGEVHHHVAFVVADDRRFAYQPNLYADAPLRGILRRRLVGDARLRRQRSSPRLSQRSHCVARAKGQRERRAAGNWGHGARRNGRLWTAHGFVLVYWTLFEGSPLFTTLCRKRFRPTLRRRLTLQCTFAPIAAKPASAPK